VEKPAKSIRRVNGEEKKINEGVLGECAQSRKGGQGSPTALQNWDPKTRSPVVRKKGECTGPGEGREQKECNREKKKASEKKKDNTPKNVTIEEGRSKWQFIVDKDRGEEKKSTAQYRKQRKTPLTLTLGREKVQKWEDHGERSFSGKTRCGLGMAGGRCDSPKNPYL